MKRIATLVAVLSLLTFGSAVAAPNSMLAWDDSGARSVCPKCTELSGGVEVAVLSLVAFGSAVATPKSAPAAENSGAEILCPNCAEPLSGVEVTIGMGQ